MGLTDKEMQAIRRIQEQIDREREEHPHPTEDDISIIPQTSQSSG